MNTFRPIYSVPVKTAAVLLSVICVLGACFGAQLSLYQYENGAGGEDAFYLSGGTQARVNEIAYFVARNDVYRMLDSGYVSYESEYLQKEKSNLRFQIYVENLENTGSELIISNYAGEEIGYETYQETELWIDRTAISRKVRIHAYLVKPLRADDLFLKMQTVGTAVSQFGRIPLYAAVSLALLWLLLQVYLACAAGHKKAPDGSDQIAQEGLHRIPFDVLILLAPFLANLFYLIWKEGLDGGSFLGGFASYSLHELYLEIGLVSCFAALIYLTLLFYGMTFAVRVKKGTLFSKMLLVRLFGWAKNGMRKMVNALPFMWKRILLYTGVLLLMLLLLAEFGFERLFIAALFLLLWAAAILMQVREAYVRKHRQEAVGRLAQGDLVTSIDIQTYSKEDRQEIENLSRIHDTVSKAVERQLSSERMKTELITNVSHDIKTPLTSIINYVDLLQKEGGYTETQKEYLEILNKQATRLKKLTIDLIEASKAATGNIAAQIVPLSLTEMIRQVMGEYAERFSKAQLELVQNLPDEEITVLADGRLLSRVLDNLLGNALKYAQPGTRVYLDLSFGDTYATIVLKNISRDPLNISEDELMERFVRGERSRHTEGSGLGLGIAKSLTELMGGLFRISIDTDLFKAYVSLRKTEPKAESDPVEANLKDNT